MEHIAVIIPCYNEEKTVGRVIKDFKRILPEAGIYVYDNMSSDGTAKEAERAGAVVESCRIQGKGAVLRQAFSEVESDIYVLVDGDDTYPPDRVPDMIEKVGSGKADIAIGVRACYHEENRSPLHALGNVIVPFLFRALYGVAYTDVMSGSRVMSREFVKGFPAKENGFGTETEMMIYAAKRGSRIVNVDVPYRDRPSGSVSKVRALRDGSHIIWLILANLRGNRRN